MTVEGFESVLPAAQAGASWAWRMIVDDVGPRLVALFRLRGVQDPEGLAQDVFVDVARGLSEFVGDAESFDSWVFVIAYRRMADEWRRVKRRPVEVSSDDGVSVDWPGLAEVSSEEVVLAGVVSDDVLEALGVLTDVQRDVVVLRVVVGLSLAETAVVLGKSVGSVKSLQKRGLDALRRHLDG